SRPPPVPGSGLRGTALDRNGSTPARDRNSWSAAKRGASLARRVFSLGEEVRFSSRRSLSLEEVFPQFRCPCTRGVQRRVVLGEQAGLFGSADFGEEVGAVVEGVGVLGFGGVHGGELGDGAERER